MLPADSDRRDLTGRMILVQKETTTMKFQRMFFTILLTATMAFAIGGTFAAVQEKADSESGSQVNYDKPGFVTQMQDGRLWVFRKDSKELEEFRKHGELVQQVIRPGAGPNRITLKAPDSQTIDDYLKAE
jgi:hypothetical protein